MSIEVTQLPDAEQRPRRVAIGSFDGVHVGPPRRDRRRRHRAHLRAAPAVSVIHPEAAPKLIMPFPVKRDVIEGLGV